MIETGAIPLSERRVNRDAHDGFAFLSGEKSYKSCDQYHASGDFCVISVQMLSDYHGNKFGYGYGNFGLFL